MITKDDLKATWTGKAIFTDGFMRTLPNAPRQSPRKPPTSEPSRWAEPKAPPRIPRPRRGGTVHYIAGPARHKPGKRGMNWTNYMVAMILAHNDTASAEATHRASGQYTDRKLDFTWMFKNQYITMKVP